VNVIDSSVALQWVLPEHGVEEAEPYLEADDSVAPDVVLVEVANVLAKKVRAGNMTGSEATQALQIVRDGFAKLVASETLISRALELSIMLSHPVYDCVFLACAERLETRLVTRDALFTKRVRDRGMGHLLQGMLP
jgi:predicted nucleic acid-binding protein